MASLRTKYDGRKIVQWVAGPHARRVPTFVAHGTGMKFKHQITEKYGTGAVFLNVDGKCRLVQKGKKDK